MTPLVIVKINVVLRPEERQRHMETIAEGIQKGALIIGSECEIIAFDSEGRLAYPVREVES